MKDYIDLIILENNSNKSNGFFIIFLNCDKYVGTNQQIDCWNRNQGRKKQAPFLMPAYN
jgi:hypothetical protein